MFFWSWLWEKSSSGCSLYARLLAKILKYAAYATGHCSWVQRLLIQTQSPTPNKCLLLLTCLGTLVWWLRLGQERGMVGLYRWNYALAWFWASTATDSFLHEEAPCFGTQMSKNSTKLRRATLSTFSRNPASFWHVRLEALEILGDRVLGTFLAKCF